MVLDSLRRIVQALRGESSRRAEQDLGVSGAQLFVLDALALAPALSVNELAYRTRTHQNVSFHGGSAAGEAWDRLPRTRRRGRAALDAGAVAGWPPIDRARARRRTEPAAARHRKLPPASRRGLAAALGALADELPRTLAACHSSDVF